MEELKRLYPNITFVDFKPKTPKELSQKINDISKLNIDNLIYVIKLQELDKNILFSLAFVDQNIPKAEMFLIYKNHSIYFDMKCKSIKLTVDIMLNDTLECNICNNCVDEINSCVTCSYQFCDDCREKLNRCPHCRRAISALK